MIDDAVGDHGAPGLTRRPRRGNGDSVMDPLTDSRLRELTDAVVAAAHPRQVILFGSRARGGEGIESDVDLLVIEDEPFSPSRSRRREAGRLRRALPRLGVAVDILLFARAEAEKWRRAQNHVVAEAFRTGKVLYERP